MANNQRQSPLLRLPGELRNKIYGYVFSDSVISVWRSSSGPPGYFNLDTFAGSRDSYSIDPTTRVTDITKTCRQIHAETRLLLFRLVTFQVHSDGSLGALLNALEDSQRDAIATLRMTTQDANHGGKQSEVVTKWLSNDYFHQEHHLELLEWAESLPFWRLQGLRRVVVEEDAQWTYTAAGEATLRAGIAHCLNDREVEIVVPRNVT